MIKKVWLILTVMALTAALPLTTLAADVYKGQESDLYQVPKEEVDNVIFTVNPDKVTVKIRIWGMTDGKNDIEGIDKVKGKTILVHSKYFNDLTKGKNNIVAKVTVDDHGWIEFTRHNPFTTVAKNKGLGFRERYTMSIEKDNLWAFVPESQYQYPDDKGNPGIEVIFTANQALRVPTSFLKDEAAIYGVLPDKAYGKEMLQNAQDQEYK